MAPYLIYTSINLRSVIRMRAEQDPIDSTPNHDIPVYSIGTVARMLGISVHTLRMYEQRGLIVSYQDSHRRHLYSGNDVERLQCIRTAITVEKISIEGIRRIMSLIPCWGIVRCAPADRESCPAYTGHSVPCWALKEKGNCARSCRECEVYREFGNCRNIKEKLKTMVNVL